VYDPSERGGRAGRFRERAPRGRRFGLTRFFPYPCGAEFPLEGTEDPQSLSSLYRASCATAEVGINDLCPGGQGRKAKTCECRLHGGMSERIMARYAMFERAAAGFGGEFRPASRRLREYGCQ